MDVDTSVRAELRAEIARQDLRVADIARMIEQKPGWLRRRLRGEVELTLGELATICEALGGSVRWRSDGQAKFERKAS